MQLNNRLSLFLFSSLLASTCQAFSPVTTRTTSIRLTDNNSNERAQKVTSLHVAGAQEAWTAYNDALQAQPLLVKSVTASVILGAADVAGQAFEDKEDKSVDIARTVRFAFFGLVLQAPWNHFYYNFLDGAIPPTAEPWTATTGIKVVIDQFIQAPIFTVLIFAFLGFLEGKSAASIKAQLDEDYVDTMFANCKST
jgi:peroxisomal membrane protein 2